MRVNPYKKPLLFMAAAAVDSAIVLTPLKGHESRAKLRDDSFPQRIERELRCAIGMVDFDLERGLVHHVGMRGRASVQPFDRDRATRLLRRYLGERVEAWDRRFQETLEDPDNVLIRFSPETVVARDQSYRAKK